jgi:DNA-binding response OmpR family regulator
MAHTASRNTIVVVEDEETLRLALVDNLQEEGYQVRSAASLAEARAEIQGDPCDLLILDIMLPDGDGYSFCRELRDQGFAAMVLMLTARTLEEDIVAGFDAGADDYIGKPYRLRELLARVQALLRRRARLAAEPDDAVPFAGFELDRSARTLKSPDGQLVELTRTEFDLLAYFLERLGSACTRQDILDEVWGRDVIVDDRTVDNFVSSLKKKLHWSDRSSFRIKAVRGIGYRMEVDDPDSHA